MQIGLCVVVSNLAEQGNTLLAGHSAAWRDVWKRGRIDIKGNTFLAQVSALCPNTRYSFMCTCLARFAQTLKMEA